MRHVVIQMITTYQTIVISTGTTIRHEEQVATSHQHLSITETDHVNGKIMTPLQHGIIHRQEYSKYKIITLYQSL